MKIRWYALILSSLFLCLCLSATTLAESPYDPVQDDPGLPRVLLIGDSISEGYTLPVRNLLKGKANVHRIPCNGQFSAFGLAHVKEWVQDGKWDVIHFNWGIWDTHTLDSNGGIIHAAQEVAGTGKIRTTTAQYQDNLNKIIDILQPTGAKLIWATTTPLGCRTGDFVNLTDRYNAAAAIVMNLRRIETDDLATLIKPRLTELQASDGVHFTSQGSEFLAKQVVDTILAALKPSNDQPAPTWTADQKSNETVEGRNVIRFEHDCLKEWGYTQDARQYFYVVEPKIKGNGPLMVCLHSAGGSGETEMPMNAKIVADAGDDFTGLILNSGAGSEWWWGADEIKAHPEKYKNKLTPVEARVLATVEWFASKYNIDRNRIYLRGISMGGSGTLGIGMTHGDVFAALRAGVPAGTTHSIYRLNNSKELKSRIGTANDVPPVFAFFSQKDEWSKGMGDWLDTISDEKFFGLTAWGPWGHLNHYEMTNAAAYEFPWLSIRKNQAYPAFTNASSDQKYPGFMSDSPDQNGQINAYFRWTVIDDQTDKFAIELRLVQNSELDGKVEIPAEVTADVTPRRFQRFGVKAYETYNWKIEQLGKVISSGTIAADDKGLLTIPSVKVTAKPSSLIISK